MFDREKKYRRAEIQSALGGELQTYLPQKNKIILAGCFNRELNPDCPYEIQAGKAPKVTWKAKLLISQPETVFPVFVKEKISSKFYKYIGMYKCTGGTNDAALVQEAESKSGRIGKLSYIFNLEEAE